MIHTPLFHYIEMKSHFLILASFQSIFSMAVWNTIDDPYTHFVFCKETKPHFLIIVSHESIFCMTVWNTIDDKFYIIPQYRNGATFLEFASF